MRNYLHDMRNKITIINTHTNRLANKYNDDEIIIIKTAVLRLNELVNEAYSQLTQENSQKDSNADDVETSFLEFTKKIEMFIEALTLSFPVELKNLIASSAINQKASLSYNVNLLIQVLENAIDNSIKADTTNLIINFFEKGNYAIVELIDNGIGVSANNNQTDDRSVLPHGLGKKIMKDNMKKMNGKIEWAPRMDGSGMIVRLFFPTSATV